MHKLTLLGVIASLATACATRPAGEQDERAAAERAGAAFTVPHPKRDLPALAFDAALVDLIHYAFQSNAEIEAAYYDWRAALERVPQAVALDDPRLAYQYMLAPSRMTRWDRTTLGLGQMVPFPGKRELAGEVAFAAAVAAGHRFEGAKFDLQADVVESACTLWLADETVRIGQANLELLRQARETAQQLVAVGRATQAEATKADLEVGIAGNDLQSQQAAVPPALARLNAILSRPPAARLRPQAPDEPRALPADDRVLSLVAERNPALHELAASLNGREDALELARKAWLPDFEFSLSLTGSIERMLMGAINLPLQVDRIRGGIAEADAMANAARVMLRARSDDLGARAVLQLYLARDGDRRARFLEATLLPRAREVVQAMEASYSTGIGSFLELLDSQRSLLQLELALAHARVQRTTAVARLEALAGVDFGTLLDQGGPR